MSLQLRLFIVATVAAAVVALAAAIFLFPVGAGIRGVPGVAFWIAMVLIASALPVRLPQGTLVSLSFAPLVAVIVLGGPVAAGIAALLGTVDSRELRGRVPWYGVLNDHSILCLSSISGGVIYVSLHVALLQALPPALGSFLALMLASGVFWSVNSALVVLLVSLRSNVPIRTIWARDMRAIAANLFALAPLGWLMAQIFSLPDGIGWWATPLFVIPLFTTRLAYSRYVETRQLFTETVAALANAVDAKDKYTHGHSRRVMRISGAMARVMKLPESQIERIEWAGLLHDIGKIGISDNILLKAGPLDREERMIMNQHPVIGAEIVSPTTQLSHEAPLIRAHHEWFNGSGYPDGLEALDIPLGARIMTIADSYEAMTSSRPYRKTPLTHEQAIGELRKYAGIQFDPEIVPVLIGLDRGILDPTPPSPDELPTMRRLPQHVPAGLNAASATPRPAAATEA